MNNKKLLFVYNGRIETDDRGNFFGNELNDKLVERYRYLGKHVTFLLRKRLINDDNKQNLQSFTSNNFSVITVPEFNSFGKLLKYNESINTIISKSVEDCDVLVARLPSTLGRKAISFAKKFRKPYLIEVVGCPWDALWNHSLLGKLVAPYAYWRMKSLVRHAPYVIYVTKLFLQNRYPNLHCSASISDVLLNSSFQSDFNERLRRYKLFQKGLNPLILGTAAAVDVKYKGQDLVFKAIRDLKSKGLAVKYFLLGKGNQENLKLLAEKFGIEEEIVFCGQIPHTNVFSWYQGIDIYIQPSRQEGLPRALVEAMSTGCVCIGTPTGGIPELLDDDMIIKGFEYQNLVTIILEMSLQSIEKNSLDNFYKAQEFLPEILDEKRKNFYDLFLNSLLLNK